MIELTIFTPTYNRAYILPKLFESLLSQKNKNFEWLIVDDGSSDNTKELLEDFKSKADFKITYVYQENQGKHVAINTGLSIVESDFFLVVDSDDILCQNFSETIEFKLQKLKESKNLAVIAFPRKQKGTENKLQINNVFQNEIISTPIELFNTYNIRGEFSLIFKARIAKEYRYPVFNGEKFIRESVVYNRIAKKYRFMYVPNAIVEAEYLEDGLSFKFGELLKTNPKGTALAMKEIMNNEANPFTERVTAADNFWTYESIYNSSFFDKLKQIKTLEMKYVFLKMRIKKLLKR